MKESTVSSPVSSRGKEQTLNFIQHEEYFVFHLDFIG